MDTYFMTDPKAGAVYLVGAGPGDPGLLTLRAAELLKTGDVIVYDRLIQEEVLALAKPSAERIYMGKPLGKHDSRQDEIHQLLLRKSAEGKMVVRLKGGDPFLFGRGGEEAEFLAGHGVPFEVVPGVSSALAAPLSAGIALTHREAASAVAIVTGHEAGDDESRLDWKALSGLDTLVFLMAVSNVGRIAQRLMEHGRAPETPAAMIQMAFWRDETVVAGTLETIAALATQARIRPPATLVVGEVVRLHEKLKQSRHNLRCRPGSGSRFEPAPAPDQLLRLATAGLGSQVLRFALAISLFDNLENWTPASDLVRLLSLNPAGLGEILECLVALGLLESGPQGYRNLELASRYLRDGSPWNLKPALLYQTAAAGRWEALARYALTGQPGEITPAGDPELHRDSCECLARYAAPAAVDKLPLSGRGSLLLVGWGEQAYRDAISQRHPGLEFDARNPFLGGQLPEGERTYGIVLLSGLLASRAGGQVDEMLRAAASRLADGGMLALHDTFLPAGGLPPPEVVLGALGRRLDRGGCRNWSIGRLHDALAALGFNSIHSTALPAGSTLVTASRT
jgi:uroporphyrin-III C-methyltransferase